MKKLLFVLMMLFSSSVFAQDWSLGIGPVRENDAVTNYKAVLIGYTVTPHLQLSVGGILGGKSTQDFSDDTHWVGVGYLEVEEHLFGSINIIRLSRQTHNLTSPYQLLLTFGAHEGPWSLSYRHISNGHTGGANYGEDMMIFGYGF